MARNHENWRPAGRQIFAGTALLLALLLLVLSLATGCVDTSQDSDLPWNGAQPWETAPAGFSNIGSRF
ncbi:MAG: hypothetical protein IJT88_09940 [Kiritimatiellae bacterium]|nr:hypothetical protein [Kiritimatiellia bacterium]MBQ9345520.1 hypothetical protein [Kiritimatiellia bacterium]